MGSLDHITICICTYRRPGLLKSLIEGLINQETESRFTYSILIVDNDREASSRTVVSDAREGSPIEIQYEVEPEQNIALARNRAVRHCSGEYLVFIDDDETPIQRWLLTLYEACQKYAAFGALGPVHPSYAEEPPAWVIEGKFYDRRTYPTGTVIGWRQGRTGNTLLKMEVFKDMEMPFRPEFRTGEDQDFFRRTIEKGFFFVWCNEAVAYETVPAIRWKRSFLLRRALLRGYTSLSHPSSKAKAILTSAIAAPAYILILPIALIRGQGEFMSLLVRLFDHVGRLLAFIGINPVREPYVTT
jgi:glycosyltransferase involved in cell wall biosynthesis